MSEPTTDNTELNYKYINERLNTSGVNKMDAHDWLDFLPYGTEVSNIVEVRFKNTRKAYFNNETGETLKKGDIVAVEAPNGHDIGVVSLTGDLVPLQMRRCRYNPNGVKKLYRKATQADVDKWYQAIDKEYSTMIIARKIADELNMNMKISDVEYQGDKSKATFYYIAEARVDFRQLIRTYADQFHVQIEMKQIGARQEASRVGGIGTCGRELCCSSWMPLFQSVNTAAARTQELVINPQKLAGQCGKLKCCLNYELKGYAEARQDFPDTSIRLETAEGTAYHVKTDVYRRILWYSYGRDADHAGLIPLDVDTVKEIIALNKQNQRPEALIPIAEEPEEPVIDYRDSSGEDSISRFEEKRKKRKKKKKSAAANQPQNQQNKQPAQQSPAPKPQPNPNAEANPQQPNPAKKKRRNKKKPANQKASDAQNPNQNPAQKPQ